MRSTIGVVLVAAGIGMGAGVDAGAQTLEQVRDRDSVTCGVQTGMPGFASPDSSGVWQGFDVALCRAVAAAVLGSASSVELVPVSAQDPFNELVAGDADLVLRGAAWSFVHDVDPRLSFAGVTYYDGQGFIVPRSSGFGSALELDGATICVQPGTAIQINLIEYFRTNNMEFRPLAVTGHAEAQQRYLGGDCEVYSAEVSVLAAMRATVADAEQHVILPEYISKEPLGTYVRADDDDWLSIVRWVFYALVLAEELGVTSTNIDVHLQGAPSGAISRLLGNDGVFGPSLGLDDNWAARAIAAGGNFGEIFASTIGEQTPIGLPRGLNAQWTHGGLLYAPPLR